MQFQLPQNLQQALLDYDPQLKKLAQQEQTKKKPKKNTNPLGVFDLNIPHDIISPEELQNVMKDLNTKPASARTFYNNQPEPGACYSCLAILNVSGIWYAAWTAPKGANYFYGYSFAFNANESTYKKLEGYLRTYADQKEPNVKCGRKLFYVHSHCVTVQDIVDNKHSCRRLIHEPILTYRDSNRGYKHVFSRIKRDIIQCLKEKNLYWEDEYNWYAKIVAMSKTPVQFILEYQGHDYKFFQGMMQQANDICYDVPDKVDIDVLSFLIKHRYKHETYNPSFILDKPFMRQWLSQIANDINNNIQSAKLRSNVFASYERLKRFIQSYCVLERIWPNSPIDFYQNNKELLYSLDTSFLHTYRSDAYVKVFKWLVDNMSIKTFINLLSKEYDLHYARALRGDNTLRPYYKCEKMDHFEFVPESIRDAMYMTKDILNKDMKIDPPKRWRDWHDHVMSIHWKLNHPCVSLPQDLFPEPIKQDGYCFFQPIDTHQLANWGRAVRNCVGNSNYSDAIRKKKCFIVLAMQDNKPKFTVQLKVQQGVMIVDQIVGLSNSRLSIEEKEIYTKTFASALQKRSEQLS